MTETIPTLGNVMFLGLLSFAILWMGKSRGFFHFPPQLWPVPITVAHVLGAFFIYFGVSTFITPLLLKFLYPLPLVKGPAFLKILSWMNFLNSAMIFCCLAILSFCLPGSVRKGILARKDSHLQGSFAIAGYAWILSFPLVLWVNQFFDWVLFHLFHATQIPEQLAVYFLKMTFGHPLYLSLAIFTIVIFAPLIEELLFRGFLQSWIRQHLGSKQAIVVTSCLFAFFHYSGEQGIANITIISSLFVFSLFIGFIYEKQGSLAAPMILHSLFNTINVCNLYFFGGIFDGNPQIHF